MQDSQKTDLISLEELAQILRLPSRPALGMMIRKRHDFFLGLPAAHKIQKKHYYKKEEIEAWLKTKGWDDEMLTYNDVAHLIGVKDSMSLSTLRCYPGVYKKYQDFPQPAVALGRRVFFRKTEIEQWRKRHERNKQHK